MNQSRLFLTALSLSISPALFAQSQADQTDLDTVVITASRAPIQADDVLQSITIITREEIERRQAVYVSELLRDVPGLSVSTSGGIGTQTQVRARGAESNHLLVMIDGIEANDPASGDEFRFEYLTTADIERIEIVRGPQSALWGTDALAGVINIITQSGTKGSSQKGNLYIEGGSNDTYHVGANLDFSSNSVTGHLGVARLDTDGTNISRVGIEDDGAESNTLTGKVNFDVSDSANIEALIRHVDAETDIDTIDFAVTGLPADADLHNEASRTYFKLAGFLDGASGRLTQSATLTYLDTDNENFSGDLETSSNASEKLGFRYQLDYKLADNHRITGALDYEDVDFSQRGTASPFGDPNQDQSIDTTGLVLEYVGHSGELWDWTIGVRQDDHSDFDDATSYQGAVGYAISDYGRIRAAFGTGRKAPTFTERFGFFANSFIGNPDLRPEESESIELGYEHTFGQGSLSLTWFDQDLTDEIDGFVFDPVVGLFTAANEDGESERSGVELAANWNFGPGFTLAGNYTYTDSTELSGNRQIDEVRRPQHSGQINFNYNNSEARTNINLNISYNGARTDLFFPPFPEPSQRVELDNFILVDIAASWQVTNHLDLFGRINNLLDEDYEEVLGFATRGTTAMAGIRYRFGQ